MKHRLGQPTNAGFGLRWYQRSNMLAERLKATREQLGMTQSEVAKASGVSKGYLSSLESGKQVDPSYRKLSDLAKALSTTAQYLYGDVDKHPDRTCETCMFWAKEPNEHWGRCKRYPPVRLWNEEEGEMETHQPYTSIDEFCGEWQKR